MLTIYCSLARSTGEGNGSPLQCSCLENPVDRGAWWATVQRVPQSQTGLKQLSMHACIGEGNGNPLRYSWLENPRDRGAWWAAIYGVSLSRTRLKQQQQLDLGTWIVPYWVASFFFFSFIFISWRLITLQYCSGFCFFNHLYFSLIWRKLFFFSSVQFSRSVVSDFLQPHEPWHARPPCPSPTPGVYPNSCPLSLWCHSAISSFLVPFSSCPQSLPASGSFPMSQLFAWGCQSIGVSASASVLPMDTQDWSPLGWTGCISLKSKGLSRVFSNTTVQKHQFFSAQLSS